MLRFVILHFVSCTGDIFILLLLLCLSSTRVIFICSIALLFVIYTFTSLYTYSQRLYMINMYTLSHFLFFELIVIFLRTKSTYAERLQNIYLCVNNYLL